MSKKILIIEDDPLLVKMYQTKFTKEGYEVITAGDGAEGLEKIRLNRPDFLIMDVMMPKVSGIQLLEIIRQDPTTASIPAIMLSNLGQPEQIEAANKLGVKEFLLKANFTPSQIVEKVKQYLV
jgi:CheY-like chemotaxis protein